MSFSEDARALEASFVEAGRLLKSLLDALQERRAAWISVRPDVVAPSAEIEQLSQQLAAQERQRAALVAKLRAALPTPAGARPDQLHVNVTRLCAALDPAQARSLRAASDEAAQLAKLVRAETALGHRLLKFAQTAQSDVDAQVLDAAKGARAPGYDRNARNRNGTNAAGQLVDGRM
ncbi:MAG: hypothetical protein ACON4Z_03430 [Planctomycetota bacterium]